MKIIPVIVKREEQSFMAVYKKVKMKDIPIVLPPLIPKMIDWVESKSLIQTGPVFFGYFSMEGEYLEVAVGVPVKNAIDGDLEIKSGKFPSGEYVAATYLGPYDNLSKVHSEIERWKNENNIGSLGIRAEFYPTDPDEEPDPAKWRTDIIVQVIM